MKHVEVSVIHHPERPGWYVTVRSQLIRGIVIPRGFACDGASVPPSVRWLCGDPIEGPNRRAGLLHDYLYATGLVPRSKADDLFYRELISGGAPTWKALLMYRAVRLFGGSHWRAFDTWHIASEGDLARWVRHTSTV